MALAYISFYTVLELFSYFLHVPQQRSMVLFETYVFWWILLAVDTGIIGSSHIGGLYFVTFFYSATLAALLVSLLEYFELPAALRKSSHPIIQDEEDRRIDRDESNERTPLLATNGRVVSQSEIEEDNELGLWIAQYLLSVPFPVILVTQIALMLLYSLNQTLADGSSPNNGQSLVSFIKTDSDIVCSVSLGSSSRDPELRSSSTVCAQDSSLCGVCRCRRPCCDSSI